MLSRGLVVSFLLMVSLYGALLVVAKSNDKPYKIDGSFTKKLRQLRQVPVNDHTELSRQNRFLDDSFEDIFDNSEEFSNDAWGRNMFSNHHNFYSPYGPGIPQYYPGWSEATNACIISNKKKIGLVFSIRECQLMCLQEDSFICRSVEYETSSGTCSLSDDTSESVNYNQPCVRGGWLFIERIDGWTEPTNACIYSTHKKVLVDEILTLEECKVRCINETDFVCNSVSYIMWTYTCSLSPETRYSPNFMMPCVHPEYTYVERLYVSPKNNPCSADPCGNNSVCLPYRNSFKCTCADGFTGIPPNCQPYQGCVDQSNCPSNSSCVDWTCVDPCVNRCGPNANCQVYNHYPSCTCPTNYTGNPYFYCSEIVHPINNPCSADQCGNNSVCLPYRNSFKCTCADGFTGIPPNCQPYQGCVDQSNCPSNSTCVDWTCVDPCVNRCGPNANCQVYNHYPSCSCPTNYTGNPYLYCSEIVPPKNNPCSAGPCGPNSICLPYRNSFKCICVDGFSGIPPNCQPYQGCVDQSNCPSNRACVGWTCVDPCVNRCGPNANCQVYNHYPSCTCPTNYTGNPYLYCSEIAAATTVSSDNQSQATTTTGTEIDTTTEYTPSFETTVAVESQTDTTNEGTMNNSEAEESLDSDSTQTPEAPVEPQTEPTVAETILPEITDPMEVEITKVNPEVRRRVPKLYEENMV